MKYTLVSTDEQDAALTVIAAKEKQTNREYIQFVFGHVLDNYVKQVRELEAVIVKDEFIKTGIWETDVAVIEAKLEKEAIVEEKE